MEINIEGHYVTDGGEEIYIEAVIKDSRQDYVWMNGEKPVLECLEVSSATIFGVKFDFNKMVKKGEFERICNDVFSGLNLFDCAVKIYEYDRTENGMYKQESDCDAVHSDFNFV